MSTETPKSAIKEVRDQLLIDYADGNYLNIVTRNLGFIRPPFGLSDDDEWRALAKNLALGPKQIEKAFRKILEICLGPDYIRTAVLASSAAVGATTLLLEDASDLVQVGMLTLSAGTASEETLEYCFVDYATNKVFLNSSTANAHSALASGSAILVSDVVATATALLLTDSSTLPEAGYPYTISLGKGTFFEELITVTNNDTATNTLTVDPIALDHSGFKADYLRRALLNATVAGRVFIVLDILDTVDFPENGWIRIDAGEAGEEIVYYEENDIDQNIFFLKTPLANAHAIGASVELLQPGADVRTANAAQLPIRWSIHDTTHDQVKILVPNELAALRIIDASWLHDTVPAILGSTTIAVETVATDTVITLASTANFPDEAGMLTIDGTERFFYVLRDEGTTSLVLTEPIGAIYIVGTTVDLFELPYASTDLEEGNPRNTGGIVIADTFPGPYIFDESQRSPSAISTTLTSLHPPATNMTADLLVGRETIECADLSLWSGITVPFQAKIGRETGFEEDITVTDVNLVTGTFGSLVSAATLIGDSTIIADATTTIDSANAFPEVVGISTARFQIVIDRGGANEEYAIVTTESRAGALYTFGLASPLTIAHGITEVLELVYDVLTVDPTTRQHQGPSYTPTRLGHPVEYLTDTISLTSSTGFSTTGGYIYLNFGKNRLNGRSRLNSIIVPTIYQFDDTSKFPTTDFPYQIALSHGTSVEELVSVTANNTGLNQLTFATAPVYTHPTGPAPFGGYAVFTTGAMELIEYQDIDVNDIILNPAQVISKHTIGELIVAAGDFAVPRKDGYSYSFLLPPDLLRCVKDMIELVRAAGIQVSIITL